MLTLPVLVCLAFAAANGGVDVETQDYPFALSLLHYGKHRCGATMIKRDVVLTSAFCAWRFRNKKDLKHLEVHAGTHLDNKLTGEILSAKELHLFPQDPDILYNVAVLRTERNFTLGAPVMMRPRGAFLPMNQGNVIGWNLTEVPGLKGLYYHLHRETVKYVGSQDRFRNFLCQTTLSSCLGQHKGDPVVTNDQLVGITFVHNVRIHENSYLTLAVNVSHPEIFDFIEEHSK